MPDSAKGDISREVECVVLNALRRSRSEAARWDNALHLEPKDFIPPMLAENLTLG